MNKKTLLLISTAAIILTGCFQSPGSYSRPIAINPEPASMIKENSNKLAIYLIKLEGGENSAEAIGCGDALSKTNFSISDNLGSAEKHLQFAIQKLLEAKSTDEAYNSLENTNVIVKSLIIENKIAKLTLEGTLNLGGICDNPRAIEQLKATLTQYPAATSAEIILNGKKIEDALSMAN